MATNEVNDDDGLGGGSRAPVALFVYNRPWHTRKTVDALKENAGAAETDLVIFSDAPKTSQDIAAVQEVRNLIKDLNGFQSVRVVVRDANMGLAKSIIEGVTQLCDAYGKVIVLEDDMVTSRYFLQFMNDALNMYADDLRVASIHGYQYPVRETLPETFFLRGADCWGWATWKRAWDLFERDGSLLLQQLKEKRLVYAFDLDGAYPYSHMLEEQVAGRNNSWAIRWHASCFLQNRLTLYPGQSFVDNIGNDSSGTHCGDTSRFSVDVRARRLVLSNISVEENAVARSIISRFLRPAWMTRAIGTVRHAIGRLRRYA